ncbi:flagellar hook-length control protein FliK [Natranaerobius trueperi]|uniref:Flagellar hook-length control protein-like C-terminal domain-containing protein n=1 Tax=Natranaerobius trueperi TaxID=759412 RepID=A0A226C1I7_9FIRM|nr:flagellar hook-length control protein FliK [Natranaerobius trueperi]OWZ84230.1 hypothetical protein CDO51_04015 [Natranaerobius trueperi]
MAEAIFDIISNPPKDRMKKVSNNNADNSSFEDVINTLVEKNEDITKDDLVKVFKDAEKTDEIFEEIKELSSLLKENDFLELLGFNSDSNDFLEEKDMLTNSLDIKDLLESIKGDLDSLINQFEANLKTNGVEFQLEDLDLDDLMLTMKLLEFKNTLEANDSNQIEKQEVTELLKSMANEESFELDNLEQKEMKNIVEMLKKLDTLNNESKQLSEIKDKLSDEQLSFIKKVISDEIKANLTQFDAKESEKLELIQDLSKLKKPTYEKEMQEIKKIREEVANIINSSEDGYKDSLLSKKILQLLNESSNDNSNLNDLLFRNSNQNNFLNNIEVTNILESKGSDSFQLVNLDKSQELIDQIRDLMIQQVKTEQHDEDFTMRLQLKPEHLGQLRMQFSYQDGELKGQIFAQNHQIREVIETNLIDLKNQLGEEGLEFSELDVDVEQGDSQKEDLDFHKYNFTGLSDLEDESETIIENNQMTSTNYENNSYMVSPSSSLDLKV